jgi:hypothetical protein
VEILGLDAGHEPEKVREQVGLLGHAHFVYEDLSGLENLRVLARLLGEPASAASEALERLGLSPKDDRPVRTYSAGMRRRLALARLFLKQPAVALLDEPFVELDPSGISELESRIRELRAAGTSRSSSPPTTSNRGFSSARTDCIWNRDDRSPHEAPWPPGLDVGPLPQGPAASMALARAGERAALLFLATLLLFSFALGPDTALLRRNAGGYLWLALLLSSVLALGDPSGSSGRTPRSRGYASSRWTPGRSSSPRESPTPFCCSRSASSWSRCWSRCSTSASSSPGPVCWD